MGILLSMLILSQPGSDRAELLLKQHRQEILRAAEAFGISPRLLASIIYAEQMLNVKPGETILEEVFAQTGYNSSLGIAQIKVNTAEWIEIQMHDPESDFHLEGKEHLLPQSAGRSELLSRLTDAKQNLLYASAYVRMIEDLWGETLAAPWLQRQRVGVVATLYSLGLVRPDGSTRKPHPNPGMNELGSVAQEFYDSFRLAGVFAE
jgi:hypothetical protein